MTTFRSEVTGRYVFLFRQEEWSPGRSASESWATMTIEEAYELLLDLVPRLGGMVALPPLDDDAEARSRVEALMQVTERIFNAGRAPPPPDEPPFSL